MSKGFTNIKNVTLTNGFAAVQHPNCDCPLRGNIFDKEEWNSRPPHPLEKKVEEFRNVMNNYEVKIEGIEDLIEEFNKLFGDKE